MQFAVLKQRHASNKPSLRKTHGMYSPAMPVDDMPSSAVQQTR